MIKDYWVKETEGWGDDPILSPVLATASSATASTTDSNGITNIIQETDDLILLSSDAYLNDASNYARYNSLDGKIVFAKRINGILTNNITVIEKSNNRNGYSKTEINNIDFLSASKIDLDSYRTKGASIEHFLLIVINEEYHLVRRTQTNDDITINETYYDITADRYLTEEFVMNSFNYGG